jgi:lipopolysaccharide/colanic/teichoic acid biosynthesis glycosyltransferase
MEGDRLNMVKRAFDILAASVALLLLWPLLLLIAILVKCDSPGPAIFRGRRVGRYGVPFTQFKFRSMQFTDVATDCSVGKGDNRVTKVGAIIRLLKMDELPQFLNVVLGDMSIVGPRPELLKYANTFTGQFTQILEVRPGLTDPASLRFSHVEEVLGTEDPDRVYEESVLPEKNLLRLEYVKTRSFWSDIRIIIATIVCLGSSLIGKMRRRDGRRR